MIALDTAIWQLWFWCALQFACAVPLQYYPFRNRLRIPAWAIIGILAALYGIIAICFQVFGYPSDVEILFYATIVALCNISLLICSTKGLLARKVFAYLLAYALVTLATSISLLAMQLLEGDLLVGCISTIVFYLIAYPFAIRFLHINMVSASHKDDSRVWRVANAPMVIFFIMFFVLTQTKVS